MKSKKIISIQMLILVIGILLCGLLVTGCAELIFADFVDHKKQVDKIMEKIPVATNFIEDNQEFLDLLLDIQGRIRAFNEDGGKESEADEFFAIDEYLISLSQVGFSITVFCEDTEYNRERVYPGNKYDLFTAYERQIIEDTCLELGEERRGMSISADVVSIYYAMYERAFLNIESPAAEAEYRYGDTYGTYERKIKINDDWCIHIYKMQYA